MASPILARIGITQDEWAEFRKLCIDKRERPSQRLAHMVLADLRDYYRKPGRGRPS